MFLTQTLTLKLLLTLQYVCRKTLADSRPRIRGRFAKNDEVPGLVEAKKALEEDEDSSDFDEVSVESVKRSFGTGSFHLQELLWRQSAG